MLLSLEHIATDVIESSHAALLKSAIMLTIHASFRQAISHLTAFQSITHLKELAPCTSVPEVVSSTKGKNFSEHSSTTSYNAAHRSRFIQLLSANPEHYLASNASYPADIIEGLPENPQEHSLRYVYGTFRMIT